MNSFSKYLIAYCVLLCSVNAYAVVQIQVDRRDIPALQGATFEAITVNGEDTDARVVESPRGAFIELDYETSADARGSAVIITPGNNTPTFQVTIPADWNGMPLRVDFETQTLAPLPFNPSDDYPFELNLTWGLGRYPATAWGTPAGISRAPEDEIRVLPAESDIDTNHLGVAFSAPIAFSPWFEENDMRIGVRYSQFEGDDSDSAQVASGEADVFSVFIGMNGMYGTGFFGGSIGIDTRYNLDFESQQYGLGFSWASDCELLGNVQMRPEVEFYWGDFDIEYNASATFIDVPDIVVSTHQQLDADYWGASVGADFSLPLSQRWSLDWGGALRYQDIDSDLMSVQNIDFFGMPESVRVESDDSDTSVGFTANLGLSYRFNEHISLAASYEHEWGTSVPGGVNPISGTPVSEGQTSDVDYDDDGFGYALLRLNIRF